MEGGSEEAVGRELEGRSGEGMVVVVEVGRDCMNRAIGKREETLLLYSSI